MKERHVQLKVRISVEVAGRFKQYVSSKHPYSIRGPLSEEVEQALIYYLNSKKGGKNNFQNTRTHEPDGDSESPITTTTSSPTIGSNNLSFNNNNNSTKYNKLIDTIKKYSNSEKQISSGLAKKAIQQIIGKDQRTVDKYLKILQDDDILYGNSRLGIYDVQSWVFGDYNNNNNNRIQQQQEEQISPSSPSTLGHNNNNNII